MAQVKELVAELQKRGMPDNKISALLRKLITDTHQRYAGLIKGCKLVEKDADA